MAKNIVNATRHYLRYQSLPDISPRLGQMFLDNQLHHLIKTNPAAGLEFTFIDRKKPFSTTTDHVLRSNYDTKPSTVAIYFDSVGTSKHDTNRILTIYHRLGLNTLLIKPNSLHFVSATNARTLVSNIIKNLDGNVVPFDVDKYIVHTNSSGSLLYALFLQEMESSKPGLRTRMHQRLIGQIFDSPLFGFVESPLRLDQMPLGLIPGFASLQRLLGHELATLYSDAAVFLTTKTPVSQCLILHSADDVISDETDALLDKWRTQHREHMTIACWLKSKHGENFARHPNKYTRTLQTFVASVSNI